MVPCATIEKKEEGL